VIYQNQRSSIIVLVKPIFHVSKPLIFDQNVIVVLNVRFKGAKVGVSLHQTPRSRGKSIASHCIHSSQPHIHRERKSQSRSQYHQPCNQPNPTPPLVSRATMNPATQPTLISTRNAKSKPQPGHHMQCPVSNPIFISQPRGCWGGDRGRGEAEG